MRRMRPTKRRVNMRRMMIIQQQTRQRRIGIGNAPPPRAWVHMYLHAGDPNFDLVKKVIGKSGSNTRDIFNATGCKLCVRGRGSGHLEPVDGRQREAPVPLM